MKRHAFDVFTHHLKAAITQAASFAASLGNPSVEPEHVLYALCRQKGSIAAEIANKAGITADSVKEAIIQHEQLTLPAATAERPQSQLSPVAKQAVEKAALIASQFAHKYVGTEHLLMALLKLDHRPLKDILRAHQVSTSDLQQHLIVVLKNTSKLPDLTGLFDQVQIMEEELAPAGPRTKERGSALEYFCNDLTTDEAQKTIDPLIGRAQELERVIHILSRRTKNNPVLIGDPGVGKTALVEGLARDIRNHTVPDALVGKRIVSLDLPLLVAGTVYRGEFESRIKQVIEEVKANTDIILFIDELHTIIGAGGASGAMDAANILKPALAKGQLRCIGATTQEEYRKHIESDPALERRFQPVTLDEPSIDETKDILRGLKSRYELFHGVAIADGAITAAAELSARYLPEKFLPDKAIDLMDEAASKLKIQKRKDDTARLIRVQEERIEEIRGKKQEAVNHEDFTLAVTLKEEEARLVRDLELLKEQRTTGAQKLVGPVTAKDIADVVSRITHIPLGQLIAQEQQRLLQLEHDLKTSIVGQDEALSAIASCIRRSRTGLSSPDRPLGSFLFLGPTGVGKTETAKVLARTVYGDPKALLQFDMSEYSESFQASKLLGAPAGYVGYKEGAKLTEGVKRRPYAVVLFDEIEKAHPDIFNLLLQILEEGHLTDSTGKRVNFKNTIIIMTSNIGLADLNRQAAIGFSSQLEGTEQEESFKALEDKVMEELHREFRPEFLNRIDRTVIFRPLQPKHLEAIVDLLLAEIRGRLSMRGMELRYGKLVRTYLASKGATPEEGARRLRRVIQEEVETPISEFLLQPKQNNAAVLTLAVQKGTLVVRTS